MQVRRISQRSGLILAVMGLLTLTAPVGADTVAYWRFEEGPDGGALLGAQGDPNPATYTTTADASGNGNVLRTWNHPGAPADTSPRYTSSVSSPTVPQTGAANNFSFNFTPNQDIYSIPGTIIENHAFNQFTIEATVNVRDLARYGNIVGKDGKPTGLPIAPFQLKQRGGSENVLQAEFIDGAGNAHSLLASFNTAANAWYHLAVVSNGATAAFYIKGPGDTDYNVQDSQAVTGGLIASTATWTVGRGFFNNNIGDWFDGLIDEVRISDTALNTSQFLGNQIPEPASLGLLGAGALLLWSRRRKA